MIVFSICYELIKMCFHCSYFVSLLNKFEIALSWDSRSLLIPSLLPTESEMVDGNVVCVNISSRTRGFGMISKQYKFPLKDHASKTEPISSNTMDLTNSNSPITRLLLMSYFPSGFWSRLITRILADEKMVDAVRKLYPLTRQLQSNITIYESFIASARWSVWQTGLALYFGNNLVFHVKEISDNCFTSPFRNSDNRFQIQQEGVWSDIDLIKPSILELYVPFNSVGLNQDSGNDQTELVIIDPDKQFMTQLLAISVDHIDLLLEDFYPAIGISYEIINYEGIKTLIIL